MGQCAKVTGLSGKTSDLSRGDKITLENLSPNRASSADPPGDYLITSGHPDANDGWTTTVRVNPATESYYYARSPRYPKVPQPFLSLFLFKPGGDHASSSTAGT